MTHEPAGLLPRPHGPDPPDSIASAAGDEAPGRSECSIGHTAYVLHSPDPQATREREHRRPRLVDERNHRCPVRARDEPVERSRQRETDRLRPLPAGCCADDARRRIRDQQHRPAIVRERRRRSVDATRPPSTARRDVIEAGHAVVADGDDSRPGRIHIHRDDRPAGVDHPSKAGNVERPPQRVLGAGRRIEPRPLECEGDTELRICLERGERACDQLTALRDTRLVARLAALRERERRERRRSREADERAEREQTEAPMPSPRLLSRQPNRTLRLVTRLPAEHRRGEDVVEDLPASSLVRAQDAVVGEHVEDAAHVVLTGACELREVGRLVRDLRARTA